MNPRQLPTSSFTDSDLARIQLVTAAARKAYNLSQCALMLSEDQAQAGDYVRLATTLPTNDSLICDAVIGERVRGTGRE